MESIFIIKGSGITSIMLRYLFLPIKTKTTLQTHIITHKVEKLLQTVCLHGEWSVNEKKEDDEKEDGGGGEGRGRGGGGEGGGGGREREEEEEEEEEIMRFPIHPTTFPI